MKQVPHWGPANIWRYHKIIYLSGLPGARDLCIPAQRLFKWCYNSVQLCIVRSYFLKQQNSEGRYSTGLKYLLQQPVASSRRRVQYRLITKELHRGCSVCLNSTNSWAFPQGCVNYKAHSKPKRQRSWMYLLLKGKVTDRLWGFQMVEVPRFQDNRHMKVVRLSALHTGRLYPPSKYSW